MEPVVIIRHTFLHVTEGGPASRLSLLRRAQTDSTLLEPLQPESYLPGLFADRRAAAQVLPGVMHVDQAQLALPEKLDSVLSDTETMTPRSASGEVFASSGASTSSSSRSSSPAPSERAAATTATDRRPLLCGQAGTGMAAGSKQLALPVPSCSRSAAVQPGKVSEEVGADGRTTVMLRNLPNNYTRAMLLKMLDKQGFAGLYDFVYMPMDFGRRAGLGYAFINLVDPAVVPRFWRAFDGFSRWVLPTAKVCSVSWSSPLQGLAAHLERYRNSPVMHPTVPDEYKPVLFVKGVRAEFPEPTRAISPPVARAPRQ